MFQSILSFLPCGLKNLQGKSSCLPVQFPLGLHTHTQAYTHTSTAHQEFTSKEWSGGILSGSSPLRCTRVVIDTGWLQEVALSYFLKKSLAAIPKCSVQPSTPAWEQKEQPPLASPPPLQSYLLAWCILGYLAKRQESCNAMSEFNTAWHIETDH